MNIQFGFGSAQIIKTKNALVLNQLLDKSSDSNGSFHYEHMSRGHSHQPKKLFPPNKKITFVLINKLIQ